MEFLGVVSTDELWDEAKGRDDPRGKPKEGKYVIFHTGSSSNKVY